ncbi:PH domain-containing protein [Gordonia sp. SL306]|uniref:PH domain-containing protein n=1 Tax=Gordonia sp. SL306 TaxID=2995145 RepID=UPI00226E72C3|nr:PH domain-containing protein [Gordonia sp. SL306]WAC56363.1 PH domain-containing protein [Gordonia sp. SL306]
MTRPDNPPAEIFRDDGPAVWHRLSPWMIAVRPIEQLPQLIPLVIAIIFAGRGALDISIILTLIAVPLITIVPWLMTRYQVTDEHVRVRSGLITRKVATARRDRIRSVDLTASVPHRVLGLKKVRIGTGGDKESSVVELNAIPATEADTLYRHLMATVARTARPSGLTEDGPSQRSVPPEQLSRLQLSWLRFAPFSLTGFAAAAAAGGLAAQFANEAGLFEQGATAAEDAINRIRDIPVPLVVTVSVIVVIAVGALLSFGGYVLAYWNFSLVRNHRDGTLLIRRGLLTTNASSLDENRVRGVHLHEPVLMRAVRGARLNAIATGSSKNPLLLPPAPFDEAVRVGQLVAHDGDELTSPLNRHGRGALTRRLTRGFWGGLLFAIVVVVAVIGPLTWPWLILAAVVAVASSALGVLRYRNLGVRVTPTAVVIAPPRVARHRYVVSREGVVGWASSASFFQRRRGVETTVVATAAGAEAYAAVDLDPAAAAELMTTVSPHLLAPFVVSR